jgi:hypothetical protein
VHAGGSEDVGVLARQDRRHRAARRQAGHVDAIGVDGVRLQHVADHAGEERRLAGAAPLVAGSEPVPALVRVRARRLRRVENEDAVLLRQLVHPRADGEVVGVLGAAVQHDHQRQRLALRTRRARTA